MSPVPRGTVVAPPSKSHAIRALVCAALGAPRSRAPDGRRASRVEFRRGPLPDDVLCAIGALRSLGFTVETDETDGADGPCVVTVVPWTGALPLPSARLDLGGSATALRLFAAVCALGPGPYELTGTAQLLRRPAGAVVGALRALGVAVDGRLGEDGALRPPLVVSGGPPRLAEVTLDASKSSHAVSALLLVAPALESGLRIRADGAVASRPYIDLTIDVMRAAGAEVDEAGGAWASDGIGGYPRARDQAVEGDWSSAAFLLAAAAATGGDVTVAGLSWTSAQADRRILDLLDRFGSRTEWTDRGVRCTGRVTRAVDADLGAAPDLAPLVGALACLVPGTTRVRGAAHLRIKETDRIAEVVRCARDLGCEAREFDDGFEVTGPVGRPARIHPAGDHRLAMAFAVAGLAVPGTQIAEPECVGKSYPAFWQDLRGLTGESPTG